MVDITGTNGSERLTDLNGRDMLKGLRSSDIFELSVDGKTDFILDFEDGIDQIDLTAFNVNWGAVQVSLKNETTFVVRTGGEKFFVTFAQPGTGDPLPPGTQLTLDDLTEEDFIFSSNAGSPPLNFIDDRPVIKDHFGTSVADVFVMEKDYQRDVIRKFDPTKDKIDLSAFNMSFADLDAFTRKPGKVIIKLGTEGLVIRDLSRTLEAEDLTADMFIF